MEKVIESYTPGIVIKYIRTLGFEQKTPVSQTAVTEIASSQKKPGGSYYSNGNVYINDVSYPGMTPPASEGVLNNVTYKVEYTSGSTAPYKITKNYNFNKLNVRLLTIEGLFNKIDASIYNNIFDQGINIGETKYTTVGTDDYRILRSTETSYYITKNGIFKADVTSKSDLINYVMPDKDYTALNIMLTSQTETSGPTSANFNKYKIDFLPGNIYRIYIEENFVAETFDSFKNSVNIDSDITTNTGTFSPEELALIEGLMQETSMADFGYLAKGVDVFGRKTRNSGSHDKVNADSTSVQVFPMDKKSATSSLTKINFYKSPLSFSKEDALDSGALVWEKQKIKDGSIGIWAVIDLNFEINNLQGIYQVNDFNGIITEIDPTTGKSKESIKDPDSTFKKMDTFIKTVTKGSKQVSFLKTDLWSYDSRLNVGSSIYICYVPKSWGTKSSVDIGNKLITFGLPYSNGRATSNDNLMHLKQATPVVLNKSAETSNNKNDSSGKTNDINYNSSARKINKTETYTLDFNLLENNSSGVAIQLLNFKNQARKNIQHTRGVEDTINDTMIDSFYVNTWGLAPGKLVLTGVIDKNMIHMDRTEKAALDFQKVCYRDSTKMDWTIEETLKHFLEWNSLPNRARFLDELRIQDLNTIKEYIVSMNSFEMKTSSDFQNMYVFTADFDILEEIGLNAASKPIPNYVPPIPIFTPIPKSSYVAPDNKSQEKDIKKIADNGIVTSTQKTAAITKASSGKTGPFIACSYLMKPGLQYPLESFFSINKENCNITANRLEYLSSSQNKQGVFFTKNISSITISNLQNNSPDQYLELYLKPTTSLSELFITQVTYKDNSIIQCPYDLYAVDKVSTSTAAKIVIKNQTYDNYSVIKRANDEVIKNKSLLTRSGETKQYYSYILSIPRNNQFDRNSADFFVKISGKTTAGISFEYTTTFDYVTYNYGTTFNSDKILKPY